VDVDAAGNGELPIGQQSLETRAAELDERAALLRTMHEAVEARAQAIEASLKEREAALLARESAAWQREDAQRLVELAMTEMEAQNSDLRQANAKLVMATLTAQELREAAQMARRRQDEFLAMLAHELRSPLAPISAAVEVLARLDGKPVPAKLLDVVRRQIKHLVRLVDDLLDVSRVTEGKVLLRRRATPVAEFVQQAVDTCRDDIAERKQRFSLDLGTEPLFVDGDQVRLTQIVTNLLQNAAKYTPNGGEISVGFRRQGDCVEIAVRDNGAGITAEALPHIFDLFVQDERPLSRSQGGLGIGLTIVRRMVEMHGGTVKALSAGRDAGSEFIVSLPVVKAPGTPTIAPRAIAALAPTPARILIVEDNVDAGAILADLLRLSGHEVEVALDGPSGLERFEQTRPQVVLCDIGLPGLDGYEVVARMRKARHEPRPALIAVTGYGGPSNVDRALMAGFDYHVVKPVDPEAVLRLIDSAVRLEDWTTTEYGAITSHGSLQEPDRRGLSR
jgi:signal transduction histidine kinase/ActR/RegA family two-component response regulator